MDRVSFSSATSDTCRATVKRHQYYLAWVFYDIQMVPSGTKYLIITEMVLFCL
jgi:hypothetical protein